MKLCFENIEDGLYNEHFSEVKMLKSNLILKQFLFINNIQMTKTICNKDALKKVNHSFALKNSLYLI